MTTETLSYRDYEIVATHKMPAWTVHIYPRLSRLPKQTSIIVDADKYRAITEANRRIDLMLHG